MSRSISSFRDLIAWQRAFALGMEAYRLSNAWPDVERFGLSLQVRRSAVSIASNIAEGYGRGSRIDYLRFLRVARGSIYELDTQMLFAIELGYLTMDTYQAAKELLDEAERVLNGLIRSIQNTSTKRPSDRS